MPMLHDTQNQSLPVRPVDNGFICSADPLRFSQAPPSCLAETRVEVCSLIREKLQQPKKQLIWLSGLVDSGKSAIAATIADDLRRCGRLAAALFLPRKHAAQKSVNSSQILPAFFLQLLDRYQHLYHFFPSHETISHITGCSDIQSQIDALFIRPLQTLNYRSDPPTVFVLDALDVCEDQRGAVDFLRHLHNALQSSDLPEFHILITSRPYSRMSDFMKEEAVRKSAGAIRLQDHDAQDDIRRFLDDAFSDIRRSHNLQVLPPWPSQDQLQELARRITNTFATAAAVVRYVAASDEPREALSIINSVHDPNPGAFSSQYDKFYLHVLESARGTKSNIYLGLIVHLEATLPREQISGLLCREIDLELGGLLSVVLLPRNEEDAIQYYHHSLPDFLKDPQRSGQYYVDPGEIHLKLAKRCFILMRERLKRDICGLLDPSKLHSEFHDFAWRCESSIPGALRYACRHWHTHMSKSASKWDGDLGDAVRTFLTTNLLHWIEALSLLGELEKATNMLQEAHRCLRSVSWDWKGVAEALLYDSRRLVLEFSDVLSISALQLYHSALPFMPQDTKIREIYGAELYRAATKVTLGLQMTWDNCSTSLDAKSSIRSIAISYDGSTITSIAHDNSLDLWDVTSGAKLSTKKPHLPASSAAFSPDGSVVGYCFPVSVVLWSPTSDKMRRISCSIGEVGRIQISHDGKQVAVCVVNSQGTGPSRFSYVVRLWDCSPQNFGKIQHTLTSDSRTLVPPYCDIAFCPDGNQLVVAAGHLVDIWDFTTGSRRPVKQVTAPSFVVSMPVTLLHRVFYIPRTDGNIVAYMRAHQDQILVLASRARSHWMDLVFDGWKYEMVGGHTTLSPSIPQPPVSSVSFTVFANCLAAIKFGDVVLPVHGNPHHSVGAPKEFGLETSPGLATWVDRFIHLWEPMKDQTFESFLKTTHITNESPHHVILPPQFPATREYFAVIKYDSQGEISNVRIVQCSGQEHEFDLSGIQGRCHGLVLSPDSSIFACLCHDPICINLVETSTLDFLLTISPAIATSTPASKYRLRQVVFSADNSMIAHVDSESGRIQVWESSTGRLLKKWTACYPVNPQFSLRSTHLSYTENAGWSAECKVVALPPATLSGSSQQDHHPLLVTEFFQEVCASLTQKSVLKSSLYAITDYAYMQTTALSTSEPNIFEGSGNLPQETSHSPSIYYMHHNDGWIYKDDRRLCWVPPRYRPSMHSDQAHEVASIERSWFTSDGHSGIMELGKGLALFQKNRYVVIQFDLTQLST